MSYAFFIATCFTYRYVPSYISFFAILHALKPSHLRYTQCNFPYVTVRCYDHRPHNRLDIPPHTYTLSMFYQHQFCSILSKLGIMYRSTAYTMFSSEAQSKSQQYPHFVLKGPHNTYANSIEAHRTKLHMSANKWKRLYSNLEEKSRQLEEGLGKGAS